MGCTSSTQKALNALEREARILKNHFPATTNVHFMLNLFLNEISNVACSAIWIYGLNETPEVAELGTGIALTFHTLSHRLRNQYTELTQHNLDMLTYTVNGSIATCLNNLYDRIRLTLTEHFTLYPRLAIKQLLNEKICHDIPAQAMPRCNICDAFLVSDEYDRSLDLIQRV